MTIRKLGEILDAAKSGGPWPTHEECYWAMLALESQWMWIDGHYREAVFNLQKRPTKLFETRLENDFQMGKRFLAADPKTWLGPANDWSDPSNRKRREISIKLYEKALAGKLPGKTPPSEGE